MSGSAAWPIQQAVHDLLAGDAVLMSQVKGVYDDAPKNAKFPYITIGDMTSAPYRVMGTFGESTTLTLHIWSQYKGFKEAAEILDSVNRLLADQLITVPGYETVASYYEFSETVRDPDGLTRHIPVRYRIQVQEQ